MDTTPKKIPLREGLWTTTASPEGAPRLLGSRCLSCGEIFFPQRSQNLCSYCQQSNFEEITLSPRGKIYSFTVVMQRPPVYYHGEVPYAIGYVELPEGVRIETLFSVDDTEKLKIGMDVELVIEKLHQDEDGNEILTYKFKPFAR